MSFTLEFHDSEVRDVVADSDAVRIRFSAASVRSPEGKRGWLPSVVLSLAQATLVGDFTQAFGKLADGAVHQDGRNAPRLALPGALAGAVELTLTFANGTLLTVQAPALVLTVTDDARFAEDLSC
jgi:hypothetical protein